MPSTFTNNLGIQLPADGELDGTWGDVVNENMQIIDRAINGSVTLTLSGTSSTLTTPEGALTPGDGQYKLLVLSGSPSGTHTITIDPSDAQKIYFVYNTTAQSVVFTQGSGGNVTIAAGDSGIIYSNGGGASAAVVNLTDHFAMSSAKITGGSITGITDLAIADGGTGASTESAARTNLGLVIGTDVQAWDVNLDQIAALVPTNNNFIVGNGTAWALETPAQALESLGVTSTAAELNILDGVTASTAELNILDGVTASTAELNYLDITTLGTSQASKALTADSGGKVLINGAQRGNIVAVGALDIDCSAGNYFTKTISGNSTFTFSNAPSSSAYAFTLELTHTSGTVTWPASVGWPFDAAPALSTGKTHLFVFITDDGGTRWRGAALVDYTN